MKQRILLILFIVSGFLFAQKRAFEIEDLYRLKYISDLQLSPDESIITYTLTSYNLKEGKSNSDIYKLDLKTKSIRQLTYYELGYIRWY